ncbi:malto-oligosyltrehalose trehalohydrolase [Salmonirosea aquatica]|uniref:Malto-oligosyltrehalose trehalohydrolase n=1 Tax=Salmonirosea aquatica TaxID=2654236 RepID=A0A7C9FG38_9BACT|nr:malto-oligosyltrehalose trehalohydrolase [Cytophagaceae bacterium SJW1-29]
MLSETHTKARTLGVNFSDEGTASIVLWAPKSSSASVLIEAKQRTITLEKKEYGYWSLETEEVKPGDEYLFVLDDGKEFPDPASLSQPGGVHGLSRAVDLKSFAWTDGDWQNIDLESYLIYEVHTGTYTSEGTFAAMEAKLDYLVDLGITAIEIMPVAQFSGDRNWGYDGVLPFCVQNSYGGAEALQHLVDKCHEKGLAVILDVVFNHIGPEGNNLDHFGHYFTDKYHTPWGNAINFDDAWCDGVRKFFKENALMWFRDFHIDALRLDAVHAIKDFSPVHILKEIKLEVEQLMWETGRLHYLIVELDLNDNRFINPVDQGGYGMDAQWIDEFHHALRVSSGQPGTGYYSDFDGVASLAKSYEDAYVYDGAFSEHRKKKFGIKASGNAGRQFVVFSQNHDHVGNRMLGERSSQLVSPSMQKLMAGAVLVSPYLPLLFMGEEYAEPNPFLYFVSHTDPELAEAVRKGRKKEFSAFHLEGEAPDPMAGETFNNSKLQWDLPDTEPHRTMLGYYKNLIAIRKKYPALNKLNRWNLRVAHDPSRQTLTLIRSHNEQQVVCFMNFSKGSHEAELPDTPGTWHKLLGSSDPQWGGQILMPESVSGRSLLTLPPESFTLYINQNE